MQKSFLICVLLFLLVKTEGIPQSVERPSWQRLGLSLGSTYFQVVKEGQVGLDSSLIYASRSLGLSRLPVLAEGIDDLALLSQVQWVDKRDPGAGIRLLAWTSGKKHLEVLILLGAYYAFEPEGITRDSARYFLTRALDESVILKEGRLGRQALCLLGKVYVQANDQKKGDSVFDRLLSITHAAGDETTEARAFEYRGLYSVFSPATTAKRIADLQKAADIYHDQHNTEGEINALTDMGYLYVPARQLDKAHDALSKALQLEESIGYPYIHYNTEALAMVTMYEGKFGEPLRYALLTVRSAEASKDSIGWAYFYSRLADLYLLEEGREKEGEDWAKKAVSRFILDGNSALYNVLLIRIGRMIMTGQGQEALLLLTDISTKLPPKNVTESMFYHLADAICRISLRQFRLAELHLSKADSLETIAEKYRGPLRKQLIYLEYGNLYFNEGQYQKARSWYARSLSEVSPLRMLVNDIIAYRNLIAIDSIAGNREAGLAHYRRYSRLKDSGFAVSKLRQAEELQVMYQTQDKENQIALLNQRSELEQSRLKQANLTKNMTIAGIVAVLIIAGLLYRQNRLKQRNNNMVTDKNEQLQRLVSEKEWLLREIHHRVKNNLQIVMSLLNSQSAFIDNETALTAIQDSQYRVHAMSLIHQKLYNSENVASIEMTFYIRELTYYLKDGYNTGQRIHFAYDIDPLELDVSQAVPIGLILNEAITNSIKYAFPNGRTGTITIALKKSGALQYQLIVADDGIGMPYEYSTQKTSSLGMKLMAGLSADLDGKISIENSSGTTIKISFIPELCIKRSGSLAETFVSTN